MANVEFGTGKTVLVLTIVAACFAVLWPKIFYPMLIGAPPQKGPPAGLDNSGCCDVIFETDINAIKIMTEVCEKILHRQNNPRLWKSFQDGKLTQEVVNACRTEVQNLCGIDIAQFLSDQVQLGASYRQILDGIRSFNISACLRKNFGVTPGSIGASRIMRIWNPRTFRPLRQERPLHLRPDIMHPALKERGRAIPPSHVVPKVSSDGETPVRPPPLPGMRPPMGAAGHVVPPPKTGGTMGIIMPLYTIGIVIFFMYTVMKVFVRKSVNDDPYKDFEPDPEFRRTVFAEDCEENSYSSATGDSVRYRKKENSPPIRKISDETTRLGWKERDTRDIEIDYLRKRLEETERAMERIVGQMGNLTLPSNLLEKSPSIPYKQQKVGHRYQYLISISTLVMTAIGGLLAEVDQQLETTGDAAEAKYSTGRQEENLEGTGTEPNNKTPQKDKPSQVKLITHTESVARETLKTSDDSSETPKVKVVGLETRAQCEGGQEWHRPPTPNLGLGGPSRGSTPLPPASPEPTSIYLTGTLPAQSQILVEDAETRAETPTGGASLSGADPPVILTGKMTLSLISVDAVDPVYPADHLNDPESDSFADLDSTLLDVDSALIDESFSSAARKTDEKQQEDETFTNYKSAEEEAEGEDTAADVSMLQDQDDLAEEYAQIWNNLEVEGVSTDDFELNEDNILDVPSGKPE